MSPDRLPRWHLAVIVVVTLAAMLVGYRIGNEFIDRLPNHRGYFLVSASDAGFRPLDSRPRRAVVVVVDGLREDAARKLSSVATLRASGQCRPQNNGDLTISRPVYTVLSTGLEADRTGARNNDETSQVVPVSIWEVARDAGLSVSGYSELTWWQQLFPAGFSNYIADDRVTTNLFELAVLADLTLIHPVYVDFAGHEQGADSPMYAEAVARVDRELTGLLANIDLSQDLVVLTADHGHTGSGGHGGPEPEVAQVLTCFAGVGVLRSDTDAAIDARILAPTLSVLLGVSFPNHMRAGSDRLDDMWTITSPELGTDYLAGRKEGVEQFRLVNRSKLAHWLGGPEREASWNSLYERERSSQTTRGIAAVLMILLGFVALARLSKLGWREGLSALGWIALVIAVAGLIYSLWRGSFGFNSINTRAEFLRYGLASGFIAGVLCSGVHVAVWRRLDWLARDLAAATLLMAALSLAHLRVYGDPIGFPLPSDAELFFPYFATMAVCSLGPLALIATVVAAVRGRYGSRGLSSSA